MECNRVQYEMPKRIPRDGTFELTVRCNLYCKMCLFRHDDLENDQLMQDELTAKQWIDMARQAANAGTLSLLITGGEPMFRPDFCEIWEGIYKQGFVMTLYTNATLVTPKIMETLRKYPPHKIGISVYGSNEVIYENVTRRKEGFWQAMNGIKTLMELPSVFEFRTTVVKDNLQDVDFIEQQIKERFGKHYSLIQTRTVMQSVRGACADVNDCRISAKDNIKLYFRREINQAKELVGLDFDIDNFKFSIDKKDKEEIDKRHLSLFDCDAGMTSYTITSEGKLQGCQILDAFYTDAVRDGFETAWREFPKNIRIPEKPKKCRECCEKEYCSVCYAMRFAETGRLDGIPEYACEDAKELKRYARLEEKDERIQKANN